MALPRSPNTLAGPYLDRAAHWRKDEERLRAALADPATLFVPVWQSRSAVVTSSAGRPAAYFAIGADALAGLDTSDFVLLGEFREHPVFAVVVASEAPPALAGGTEFHDLRLIAGECLPKKPGCSPTPARCSTGGSITAIAGVAARRRSPRKADTSCGAPKIGRAHV